MTVLLQCSWCVSSVLFRCLCYVVIQFKPISGNVMAVLFVCSCLAVAANIINNIVMFMYVVQMLSQC